MAQWVNKASPVAEERSEDKVKQERNRIDFIK
jgi:hypothetical protein